MLVGDMRPNVLSLSREDPRGMKKHGAGMVMRVLVGCSDQLARRINPDPAKWLARTHEDASPYESDLPSC